MVIITKIKIEYTSSDKYKITGRGTTYVVKNDRERKIGDWGDISGQIVKIDGMKFKVRGIEYHTHEGVIKEGTTIALVVGDEIK